VRSTPAIKTEPSIPLPRDGESITEYCAKLPKRRPAHTAKGLLLRFPRTGLVGVPYEPRPSQSGTNWAVVVVAPDRAGIYQPGGYDLSVSALEVETAIELEAVSPEGHRG